MRKLGFFPVIEPDCRVLTALIYLLDRFEFRPEKSLIRAIYRVAQSG